ncbi:MAG: hypothetical protein HY042_05440 [Spirochaetia bacterium]|nr:hypothetical protein [Spirochaetia bacterium]
MAHGDEWQERPGRYVVVVGGPDQAARSFTFDMLQDAKNFADDSASETENGPTYAHVEDRSGKILYHGQHYAAGR